MSKLIAELYPQLEQIVLSSTLASSDAVAVSRELQHRADMYAKRAAMAPEISKARSDEIRGAVRLAIRQTLDERPGLGPRELTSFVRTRAMKILGTTKRPDEDLVREEINAGFRF
jgi:hypothetical protein